MLTWKSRNNAELQPLRVLGMIRRNITYNDKCLIVPLYKAIVRPHLDYCIQARSPYLRKAIDMLEKIQRRATKLIPGLRDLRYPWMAILLNHVKYYDRMRLAGLIESTFFELCSCFESITKLFNSKVRCPYSTLDTSTIIYNFYDDIRWWWDEISRVNIIDWCSTDDCQGRQIFNHTIVKDVRFSTTRLSRTSDFQPHDCQGRQIFNHTIVKDVGFPTNIYILRPTLLLLDLFSVYCILPPATKKEHNAFIHYPNDPANGLLKMSKLRNSILCFRNTNLSTGSPVFSTRCCPSYCILIYHTTRHTISTIA